MELQHHIGDYSTYISEDDPAFAARCVYSAEPQRPVIRKTTPLAVRRRLHRAAYVNHWNRVTVHTYPFVVRGKLNSVTVYPHALPCGRKNRLG